MSSKRGRKRNDNLPPNRARDVQRAFRARRAAHLEALEQRVAELEEENSNFRAALNLPPSTRPSLGKGPTGKDRPKTFTPSPTSVASSSRIEIPTPIQLDDPSYRGGSSGDSPSSMRSLSVSPANPSSIMRPSSHASHSMESAPWDQNLPLSDEPSSSGTHGSPPSAGYSLANAASHKPTAQYAYSSPVPPPRSMSAGLYVALPQDRSPMMDSYGTAAYGVRDVREEPTSHYAYSQPSYSPHEHAQPHMALQPLSLQRDPSILPYANRRAITEPQDYRSLQFGQPQQPVLSQLNFRRLTPPRLPDASHLLRPPYASGDP